MKNFNSNIKVVIPTIFLTVTIMILPCFFFKFLDVELLKKEETIQTKKVNANEQSLSHMSIEERINMLNEEASIDSIMLETGYSYSLYEAKIKCFDELYKIPSLEIDQYGPPEQEIDIVPFLMINSKRLSEKMIVWKGKLEVKEVEYFIILDEETGKVLKIESGEWKDEEYKNIVLKDWKKYIEESDI